MKLFYVALTPRKFDDFPTALDGFGVASPRGSTLFERHHRKECLEIVAHRSCQRELFVREVLALLSTTKEIGDEILCMQQVPVGEAWPLRIPQRLHLGRCLLGVRAVVAQRS